MEQGKLLNTQAKEFKYNRERKRMTFTFGENLVFVFWFSGHLVW